MSRIVFFRVLTVVALSLALVCIPKSSFAQRGGGFHGGGGGFHGGGSFHGGGFSGGSSGFHSSGGFHGSGSFGAFRGGRGFGGRGFGGFRGNGFRGGRFFGGYPGFYSGFGFGFGFWPYWDPYAYGYGYDSWWGPYGYAYPYGYGDAYGYGYDDGYGYGGGYGDRGCGDDQCAKPNDRYRRDNRDCEDYRRPCSSPDNKPSSDNGPSKPSNSTAPRSSADRSYVTVNFAPSRNKTANNVRLAKGSDGAAASELRPPVRNVIAALRAMPPAARERQLNSGRYDNLSPAERELLIQASQNAVVATRN